MRERFLRFVAQWLAVHVEWEVQTTDTQGCWRTWSSGFPSFLQADEQMRKDSAAGLRWNKLMPDSMVQWRVCRSFVFTTYFPL